MQHYSDDELRKIFINPHLLGHFAGKDKLTPMHSDWIKYIWTNKEHRSLQAHRGSYKTTSITEIGAILWLASHPDDRIAIVKKTYTNAAESVRNIANMMMMPDVYDFLEDMWGKWKFSTLKDGKFTTSVKRTRTQQGSMEALGADSSFTGKHYDKIMIDDIIDLDDRLSEAERLHTNTIINELYSNVVDPGKTIGSTGTPWHRLDAWSIMPPARKFTITDTHLFTAEEIAIKRKFTTPVLWAVNYNLVFESEQDMMFLNPHLGKWHREDVVRVKAHVDAAYDGNHYCALTIMAQLKNRKFNAAGWIYPGNIKDWIPFVVQKMVAYGCDGLYMEENADRGYSADAFRKHPAVQNAHIWVTDYDERMKKDSKISTYLYEIWKDIEWDEAGMDKNYLEQVTDYMADQEPNDAPDSAASLCREAKFSIVKHWDSAIWRF
jgi:hypothetical protein